MGLDVEGNRLVPFLNDTHVFSTLVRFSVVALPLPLVHGFLPFLLLLWLVSVVLCFGVVASLVCLVASLSGGLARAPFAGWCVSVSC